MDNSNGRERVVLLMRREDGFEFEVRDLVPIQGEECLVINVAAYGQPEAFACPPWYCVYAVLDLDSEASAVAKEFDYLILQISDAQNNVRDSVGL